MVRWRFVVSSVSAAALVLLSVVLLAGSFAAPALADGRLNCQNASPVVIYCNEYGIEIWDTSGQEVLFVSSDDIDAVGIPDENTLIAASDDMRIRVYRLATGEFQVNVYNGLEEWVAIWEGCAPESADVKAYSLLTGELLSDEDGCEVIEPAPPAEPTAPPTEEPIFNGELTAA
jgi:hypothetical protein